MSERTMRAVAFESARALGRVDDHPVPEPRPGQALLRVSACGVCGSDLHMYEIGRMPIGSVLGHEFVGVVEAVGRDGDARIGERYVCWPLLACRQCDACTAGLLDQCRQPLRIGLGGSVGGYAEYALVDVETSLPVPDSLDDTTAALTEPLSVGLHGIRISSIRPGDRVLVVGAGCIGLMALQCVLLAGAADVSVIEPAAQRARAARDFGATRVFEDVEEARDALAGHPVDVAVECAGAPGTLQLCVDLVRQRGEVVGLGVVSEDRIRPSSWLMKEITLKMASEIRESFGLALDLLRSERVRPAGMVSLRARLEDLPALFEDGARREVKILVVPTGG